MSLSISEANYYKMTLLVETFLFAMILTFLKLLKHHVHWHNSPRILWYSFRDVPDMSVLFVVFIVHFAYLAHYCLFSLYLLLLPIMQCMEWRGFCFFRSRCVYLCSFSLLLDLSLSLSSFFYLVSSFFPGLPSRLSLLFSVCTSYNKLGYYFGVSVITRNDLFLQCATNIALNPDCRIGDGSCSLVVSSPTKQLVSIYDPYRTNGSTISYYRGDPWSNAISNIPLPANTTVGI